MRSDNIDFEKVMKDMGDLHQEMNKGEIAVTEIEKQGLIVFDRCTGVILNLLLEKDCSPQVIELSLFYFFHEMFARHNNLTGLPSDPLEANLPAATDLMANIANTIKDSGPDENAEKMAEMISLLSSQVEHKQQSKSQTAIDAQEVNSAVVGFVNQSVSDSLPPILIQHALLYNWLRISVINAKAPERIFQIIERNWPEAVKMFDAYYLKHLQSGKGS